MPTCSRNYSLTSLRVLICFSFILLIISIMLTNHSLCAMLNFCTQKFYLSPKSLKREKNLCLRIFPSLLGALVGTSLVGSLKANILADYCGATLKGLVHFLFWDHFSNNSFLSVLSQPISFPKSIRHVLCGMIFLSMMRKANLQIPSRHWERNFFPLIPDKI